MESNRSRPDPTFVLTSLRHLRGVFRRAGLADRCTIGPSPARVATPGDLGRSTGMADIQSTVTHGDSPLTHGDSPSTYGDSPPLRAGRKKMADTRRSHSERSIVANYKNPSRRVYSIKDLETHGWLIDDMDDDYDEWILSGRCPLWCRRPAILIPRKQITVDIIDPDLPWVWRFNTQFACLPDNSRKRNMTRAQLIEQQLVLLDSQAITRLGIGQLRLFD